MRVALRLVLALPLLVGGAACRPAPLPTAFTTAPTGRVRTFSESASVVDLTTAGRETLWVVGNHGLIRWDLHSGGFARVGTSEGLPGQHATAIVADGRGTLWLATENGIAYRDRGAQRWQTLPAPDVGDRVTALAASTAGTLWAGGPSGVAWWHGRGKWESTLKGQSVTSLLPDPEGDRAWIGTREAGVGRITAGKVALLGPTAGNLVREVRGLARTPDGALMLAGMSAGRARLALHDGQHTFSYRLEPDGEIGFLRQVGGDLLLGLGRAVYTLKRVPTDGPTGKLRVDPIDPPKGEHAPAPPRWEGHLVPLELPAGVTQTYATDTDLWIGTRSVGVARWRGQEVAFYRTHDLTESAERLTVACVSADECYLATGGPVAWWFDGRGFVPAEIDREPGSHVLAVVRDARGNVVAIHRGAKGRGVRLSRVNQGVWSTVAMQDIEVPQGQAELTFAAFGPSVATGGRVPAQGSQRLWLGLQYREASGEMRFHGVAEVDVDGGRVQYHRQFPRGSAAPPGTLPIPNDCTAVYFGVDQIWFATKSGATRVTVASSKVHIFTENDGLESELLRDVAAGDRALQVVVATDRGVGQFDGQQWRFARSGPLKWRARALARAADGTLWVATDRGLVAVAADGVKTRVYDSHAGLLDDDVRDVEIDLLGRVWALGKSGLTLIEP